MKKLLLIISSLIILSSCMSDVGVNPDISSDNPFILISTGRVGLSPFYIAYDKDTQVMYVVSFVDGGITFSHLLNSDGTHRLYENH